MKRQTSALQRWARSGFAPDSRFSRLTGGHLTAHLFQESAAAARRPASRRHAALAFGDVDDADSSQATAINAVAQRISMAMGVAIAGGILEISSSFHDGRLLVSDFHVAFFSVSAISALACITFLPLPRDAGAELTARGRKRRRIEPEEAVAENS